MRSIKRLALIGLFALPMVLTGCETLGDATGPNMQAPGAPSAAKGGNPPSDSTSTSPSPKQGPTQKGFEIGWP